MKGRALGKAGSKVVASADFYDQSKCKDGSSGGWSRGATSSVCDPDLAFHRLGLNGAPGAMKGRHLNMTTTHGNSKGLFRLGSPIIYLASIKNLIQANCSKKIKHSVKSELNAEKIISRIFL